MKQSKAMKAIAEMSKKTAVKSTEMVSRWWLHQPKMPAKLMELKK